MTAIGEEKMYQARLNEHERLDEFIRNDSNVWKSMDVTLFFDEYITSLSQPYDRPPTFLTSIELIIRIIYSTVDEFGLCPSRIT